MSTDYNYDEKGQFFPYFVFTVTALFTIPTTYYTFKPGKQLEVTAPRIITNFKPDNADLELIEKQRRAQKRRQRKLKRMIASAVGWVVMAWMLYLMVVVTTKKTAADIWDPYEMLGIKRGATEKEVTKHYRKLSLTMHPDKRRADEAKNVTVEQINDDWVELTKAFKSLTDEEVRKNWELYGHPDGKQSFSIGIALPQFIISKGNGKYVLLLYGGLLGILLPLLVGRWWYGTQKVTKERILVSSATKLFKEYQEEMSEGAVIGALSCGDEFEEVVKPEESFASAERMILKADDNLMGLTAADKEQLANLSDEQRRKALGLIWSYLGRVDLANPALNEQKYAASPIAFALNESFLTMAPFFGNMQPLLASYRISQSLIQALPPSASPLLQLPYITPEIAAHIDQATGVKNTTIQTIMSLPDSRRRKLLSQLSPDQYATVTSVVSQLPLARIEAAFFKVVGERYITPGSLIQFVIKLRIIPPGFAPIPSVTASDLLDIDPKEGDVDALHGRKKKIDASGKPIPGSSDEDNKPIQPPLAHAPFFPQDHSPRWRVFLGENKSGKIAVPPFTFSTFDKPVFTYSEDGTKATPTCNVQTLKCQFQAPAGAGEYPFTMHLVCDSYLGLDSVRDVIMKVDEASKAEEVESEEEISEAEEDSIAGQMAALKSGGAAPKPRRKRVPETADDISSGSDTDGDDDGDDDSDTDTDTDTDED